MKRLIFSIQTLSSIVLSSTSNSTVMTETHSAFSGSIIRGILATRFVEVKNLDKTAHEDADFREIFYGGLKFLPANPAINNRCSSILPLSLQKGKDGTDDAVKIQDLLFDETPRQGYKGFRGFGLIDGNKISKVSVGTNIFMHMSRSGDGIVDGKKVFERLSGKSELGQIYNYEAIDAEQNFCGEILGDEKILQKLLDGLNSDKGELTVYIGRSRFTQYGKCLLKFEGIKELDEQNFSDKIFLRLETPLIPFNDCFISAKEVLKTEVIDKLGEKFSLGNVFASCVETENFVVPWGMKRPRVTALAAGSVFEVKTSGLSDTDKKILAEKIFEGLGTRTEEGFGQLRLWTPSEYELIKAEEQLLSCSKEFSDYTIELAKKILKTHLLERVRLYAHEDAKNLCSQLKGDNMTHFFSRLDVILANTDKKNLRENFAVQIELEASKSVQFKDNLDKIRMNNQRFYDVFTKSKKFPHEINDLTADESLKKVREVIAFDEKDFSDDDFVAEYLTHYFRSARKFAAESKGGAAHE